MADNKNYWSFRFKRGPEPATSGLVEAPDAGMAWQVAQKWCEKNNARGPLGDIAPMVLADRTILEPEPAEAKKAS